MTEACLEEDTILAFVEGRLGAPALRALESHARSCPSCGELLAAAVGATHDVAPRPAPPTPAVLTRGSSVGRYIVLAIVGRGAMGEVFAAYDPELDRKIALKLLRPDGELRGERGRGRLLREAKAIARLSHPNVVVVHDAGTFDDRVFVAMEFVEGHTLAAWLIERTRPQDDILAVFIAAARGLSAAHAAGLVHRDFKPQNVMVGAAGQVRVMDFGLARPIDDPIRNDGDGGEGDSDGDGVVMQADWDLTLTRSGDVLGTPLYMSPEQFQARRTDAQTDQFSFCVALYRAVYGVHPFRCDTLVQLMSNVSAGIVEPPPPKSAVPAWLRRVLLRGLSVEPTARWPSMDALITALERRPARARRRGILGAVALTLAIVAGLGLSRFGRRDDSFCRAGPTRLVGLWETIPGGARREQVHRAFLGSGLPYAAETWNRAAALLDGYAADWTRMYTDACEATHRRGEQSAEVLDLRMTCLDEQLTRMRALVDVLATADREATSRAVDAASALPAVARCGDVKLLRSPVEPPASESARLRVEALRQRAAVVDALNVTGQLERGHTLGRALITDARALGYAPLTAELLERLWRFSDSAAHGQEAEPDLEEATLLALASRRDDVAAEASALLSGVVGYALARHADGERWAAIATAIVDRLGPGHDLVRSWILQNRAAILSRNHQLDQALAMIRQAAALKERALPAGAPDIALAIDTEAEILFQRGDAAGALARNLVAWDSFLHAYGPGSSWLAHNLSNRGEYLVALNRLPEGIAAFQQGLSLWKAHLGPDHRYIAYPLTGLGVAHWKDGHPAEALVPLERALDIREAHEPDAATVAETRFALARALWDARRDRVRAHRLAVEAREVFDRDPGRQHEAREVALWLAERPAR